MFIRLRVRTKPGGDESIKTPEGYPVRASSVIASLGFHGIFVLSLGLISMGGEKSRRPVYDELIKPYEHKIIIYRPPKALPDVNPTIAIGHSKVPQGAEVSKQAIIARSAKAKSVEQFILLPAPKLEIPKDIPAPNLIFRANTSLPSSPEPIKQPDPPPAEPKAEAPAPKPVKTFIPPQRTQPRLPLPIPVIDAPTPVTTAATEPRLPPGQGLSKLPISSIPTAPIAPTASVGNARVDIAIAGLHPAEKSTELPEGDRAGRFSKAPTTGQEASGTDGKPAITVPGLSVREDKTASEKIPAPAPKMKTILYAERVPNISFSTLSVPLRPSSRTIPRAVDAQFQGRSVYTMVIPIENLPAYSGDWIVWFAELAPKPGESPLMRTPLPLRKIEQVEENPTAKRTGTRVQIAGILDKNGRIGKISLLTKVGSSIERAVRDDVACWEFKPATRNGVPVDVEVVIEITFNLPLALAERSSP